MSIKADQLTKIYGKQRAVDQLNFEIKSGEIVGFLGPNGAGKTTTMKMLTCYVPPSSGQAWVNGLHIEEQSIEVRKNIGYLPEHNPLYTDMYVKEYLLFAASFYAIRDKQKRVDEMIQLTGLQVEQNKKIGQLSKGYRQRVGLAQAMIHNPSVLILDEPTSGLDPNQIVEIRNLISQIGKEKTVLLSTHIMQEVEAMCNRVMIIHKGRIVADGTTAEIKNSYKNETVLHATFNRSLSDAELVALNTLGESVQSGDYSYTIRSDQEAETFKSAVFHFAVTHGLVLTEMKTDAGSLEEIFKKVTR